MKKHNNFRWLFLSLSIILFDQATKYFAIKYLTPSVPVQIFPFFDLSLNYNPGVAFSLLSTAPGWQRWFLSVLTVLICSVLLVWMKRISKNRHCLLASLVCILGGAIGNLLDRIYFGYVIDFIDLHIKHWHWPTFNIADTAISVGVTILIIMTLLERGQTKKFNIS
jgi:signal peptidase II